MKLIAHWDKRLLVNFNVWKLYEVGDWKFRFHLLIWHPTKNCHFGPFDHLMYIFLCDEY